MSTKKLVDKAVKTPEQIADELKAQEAFLKEQAEIQKKHNVAVAIRLKVGDAVAWVKKPGRAEVSMSRSLGEGDYIKINELLLDAIWLEGDDKIRTDDDYFLNAIPYLDQLVELKAVELKKN